MQNKAQSRRQTEGNYNLLRVICAVAVVVLHASARYVTDYEDISTPHRGQIFASLFYNQMTRFAVPCFFMLSGAFTIGNEKNQNYRYFYRKSFVKIGIPTIIFSLIYFLYSEASAYRNFSKEGASVFIRPLKEFLAGEPYYHMWYLYTLIGIYILIPVIVKIRLDIGEEYFSKMWIYFIISLISGLTSSNMLNWSVSKVALYIGYVMAGYQIRKKYKENKNNLKGIFMIVLSIVLLLIHTYILYIKTVSGIDEIPEILAMGDHFNVLIAPASLLMFAGFSCLSVKPDFLKGLSGHTFMIYLIHAGVMSVLCNTVIKTTNEISKPIYTVPIISVVTFAVSWVMAIIYDILWKKLDSNGRISDKFCKLLRL